MSELRPNNERSLVPAVTGGGDFRSFISSQLVRRPDGTKPNIPLGAIMFDQDRQMMLVAESESQIVTSDIQTPQGFEPASLISSAERIVKLPHLSGIVPTQINLEDAIVRTHRSLRGRPTVETRLPFTDPVSGQPESLVLPEADFLRVFKGENGRVATFSGGDMPEEVALVMERDFQSEGQRKRYGLVFFIHPSDADINLDSVTGFHAFISKANEQFADLLQPDEAQYLTRLDEAVSKRKIRLESDVEIELLKSVIIANIRLGDSTGINDVSVLLQGVGERGMDRFNPFLRMSDEKRTAKANSFIDQAVGKEIAPSVNAERLLSPRGQELGEILSSTLTYGSAGELDALNTLMGWSLNAISEAELADITTLIRRYDKTLPILPLNAIHIRQYNKDHGNRVVFDHSSLNGYDSRITGYLEGRQIRGYFANLVENRRAALVRSRLQNLQS